jgi:hypothetical protein
MRACGSFSAIGAATHALGGLALDGNAAAKRTKRSLCGKRGPGFRNRRRAGAFEVQLLEIVPELGLGSIATFGAGAVDSVPV